MRPLSVLLDRAAACATGTFSGLTAGAECGFNTAKSVLTKYTAACQYVQPDFTVVAKMCAALAPLHRPPSQQPRPRPSPHAPSPRARPRVSLAPKASALDFTGSYYHKVSGEMQVGADITKKASKSDVDLGFGCLYKLDKTTTVKGKARGLAPAPLALWPPPRSPRALPLTHASHARTRRTPPPSPCALPSHLSSALGRARGPKD